MHFGASAVGADARRRDAGDAAAHLPGAATKQMPPRPSGLGSPAKCICYFLTDPKNETEPRRGLNVGEITASSDE